MTGMQHKHKMDTHNMLVVGEKSVYLSHLPMFEGNHVFQLIMKATFQGAAANAQQLYAEDRRKNPQTKMYTLGPDPEMPFVLEELFTPDPQHPKRSTFHGTVFRGHLERRPHEPVLTNITVEVERVIHVHVLPLSTKPEKLEYLLFGEGQELFLAHMISRPPDFDQILSVAMIGHEFTDEQLGSGVRVVIPGKQNAATERLDENEQALGVVQNSGAATQKINLKAGVEFYFEEGELFVPPVFGQTPEEKKAGF
jgi:hypothetical protein